jgi:hypothetical protein
MSTREQEHKQLRRILGEMNMNMLASNDLVFEDFMTRLANFFAAYDKRARQFRSRGLPTTINLNTFLREYDDNPHRVMVMLQAVAFLCTPEMLAMMWMVLLGSRIETLSYTYEQRRVSKLTVKIVLPDRVTQEHFESEEHWDTAILRFVGISKADNAPVIESFHAIHIPRQADRTGVA